MALHGKMLDDQTPVFPDDSKEPDDKWGRFFELLPVLLVLLVVVALIAAFQDKNVVDATNGPIIAQKARVVAECGGIYMTAMEEDQLPLNCGEVESIDHLFADHFE